MFVTLFYATFNPANGRIAVRERGAQSALRHQGQDGERGADRLRLRASFSPMHARASSSPGVAIELEQGDVVFFYTDGITEAMNEEGEEFGDNTN